MPQFLIDRLKREYPGNDNAVYGTLNKIGAMHGNKETAKGREMEAKHNSHLIRAQGGVVADPEVDEYGNPIMGTPQPRLQKPAPPADIPPPRPIAEAPQVADAGPIPRPVAPAPPPPGPMPPASPMGSASADEGPGPIEPPSPTPGIPPRPVVNTGPPAVGQDPRQLRSRQWSEQMWNKAQQKVPLWRQIAGTALSISPRTAGIGQAIMHPPDQMEAQGRNILAGAKQAEDEQKTQALVNWHSEATAAQKEARLASVAQRLATIKPALTPLDRFKQAKEIPDITDEQMMEFALNGKVKPLSEKPEQFGTAPPGSTIYNKTTGAPGATAPEKEPRNTKTEDLEQTVAAKIKIADTQKLKGAERQHFIYGTPIPNQNIINIPGLGQGTASSASTASGEEFLKTLPSGTAAQIRAISEGRAALPPLSSRGSGALLRDAVFKYDPEFNEQRAQMRRAFTSGKQGDNIRALNTATVHLGQLHEAAEAMKNGNFQPGNQIYNYVTQKFGNRATTDYAFVMNSLAGEAATALKGNATDPEIAHVMSTLSQNMSPQQALGVTEAGLHVFGAKLNTADESYRQANPGDRVWSPVLPSAKAVYEKYGVNPLPGPKTPAPAVSQHKVGDSVMYNGAAHKIIEIKPNGKLVLQ